MSIDDLTNKKLSLFEKAKKLQQLLNEKDWMSELSEQRDNIGEDQVVQDNNNNESSISDLHQDQEVSVHTFKEDDLSRSDTLSKEDIMVFYRDLEQHLKGNPVDAIGTRDALGFRERHDLEVRDQI